MHKNHIKALASAFLTSTLAAASFQAQAGLITFETLNADPAATVVNAQFTGSDGVTFISNPILGKRGGTISGGTVEGWQYVNGTDNGDEWVGNEGDNAGDNFISDVADNSSNGGTALLEVEYSVAVAALAFDLYDIDFNEGYTLTIFSDAAMTVALDSFTIDATDSRAGDGTTIRVGFDWGTDEILALRVFGDANFLDPQGGRTAFGLGFDNFNTSNFDVPVPAPLALIGLGLLGLGASRRFKKA